MLRAWLEVDLGDEYRCIVCGGQLTALLQYNDMCFYPHIAASIEQLTRTIRDWFEQMVAPVLPYEHCVLDVHLRPDSNQVDLIEINPFGPATGIPFSGGWAGIRHKLQGGRDVSYTLWLVDCV